MSEKENDTNLNLSPVKQDESLEESKDKRVKVVEVLAMDNNAVELLKDSKVLDRELSIRFEDKLAEEIKNILLNDVIIGGDLIEDYAYNEEKDIGVASLKVKGRTPEEALKFFSPMVEEFACMGSNRDQIILDEKYEEAMKEATLGNLEQYTMLLRKVAIDPEYSNGHNASQAMIELNDKNLTYVTASGGCEVSLDIDDNTVTFKKLDESQGVSKYSFMRGSEFLINIMYELQNESVEKTREVIAKELLSFVKENLDFEEAFCADFKFADEDFTFISMWGSSNYSNVQFKKELTGEIFTVRFPSWIGGENDKPEWLSPDANVTFSEKMNSNSYDVIYSEEKVTEEV